MKRVWTCCWVVFFVLSASGFAIAASQDKYQLPEPYIGWEKTYLQKFPQLQDIMDVMIMKTAEQVKKPDQDILHNRVCSAIAFRMAKEENLPENMQKLSVATDLLHNISKAEKKLVLTDPVVLGQCSEMVQNLKKQGYFKASPRFWSDEKVLQNPNIGGKRGLIHHITGALMAGQIMDKMKGSDKKNISELQVAILEHSTGYWYFRDMVDKAAGQKGAWEIVFPKPVTQIGKFAHDADLISQFVPESVTPEGSKWRNLAKKRWKAKNTQEEGQIVYYVFFRLYEEALTGLGKKMAQEKWEIIRPELVKLMGLSPDQDPIKVLGVPGIFKKK